MFRNYCILFLVTFALLFAPNIGSAAEPVVGKQPVNAVGEPKYEQKLRTTRFLMHLSAMPAYALIENALHEGSHGLWVVAQGRKITGYKPYPHFQEDGAGRHFYLGWMSSEGSFSKREEALVLAGPTITDFTLFTATDLVLTYGVDPNAWYAPILFMVGMLWPTIDWITTMNGWSPTTDIARFCNYTGTNRVALTIVGDAMAAVAIWRLLHHGRNIFFMKIPIADVPAVTVSPIVSGNVTGLIIAGTF